MTANPLQLLRALGSGIRPVGVERPAGAGSGVHTASFEELLKKASAGEINSGAPVRLGSGCEVSLTLEQMQRLSVAADRAEAAGATRAVVLIDGMALTMDVGVRTITGQIDPAQAGVTTGVDAVLSVPAGATGGAAGGAAGALPLAFPGAGRVVRGPS